MGRCLVLQDTCKNCAPLRVTLSLAVNFYRSCVGLVDSEVKTSARGTRKASSMKRLKPQSVLVAQEELSLFVRCAPAHREAPNDNIVSAQLYHFAHRSAELELPAGQGVRKMRSGAQGNKQRKCSVELKRCGMLGSTWFASAVLLTLLLPDTVQGVCSVGDGRGPTIRGIRAVLGIEGTVTDPAGNLQGTPVPGPHRIVAESSGNRQRISAVVGSKIEFNISAAWGWDAGGTGSGAPSPPVTPWPEDLWRGYWYGNEIYGDYNLTLYAYEDPGVPNGAVLTTQTCLGYPQQYWDRNTQPPSLKNPYGTVICNPVQRTFTWEPRKGQEGLVHSMCFTVLVKELPNECQADYRCIDIDIRAPDLQVRPCLSSMHARARSFAEYLDTRVNVETSRAPRLPADMSRSAIPRVSALVSPTCG